MKQAKFFPYGRQSIDQSDIVAVTKVLRSDFLTQGPAVEKFEKAIARYTKSKYAVAYSSGTAALHGACFAAGISIGDEVITTPLTFAASANCVLYCGGNVSFVDVKKETPLIDPKLIQKAITQNTKAVISVDYSGLPVDYTEIQKIARMNNLVFIADAAHSLGAFYHGAPVGQHADMTVFSFHPVKAITTGEGGMVVTNNESFYNKLQIFRTHGITKKSQFFTHMSDGPWYHEMQVLGYNYRLTDIQAALGYSQSKKLSRFVSRRQKIANLYKNLLSSDSRITLVEVPPGNTSAWHLFPIFLSTDELLKNKLSLVESLHKAGIRVQIHYIPTHQHPYYQERFAYKKEDFPNAEKFYQREISLPIYPALTYEDIKYIVEIVQKLLTKYSH